MFFDATSYISEDIVLAFLFSFVSGLLYWLCSFWVPFPFPVFLSLRCLVFLGCPVTLNLSGWGLLPCELWGQGWSQVILLPTSQWPVFCVCVRVGSSCRDGLFSLRIVEWQMIGEPGVEVAERQESHVFSHFQNRQALQVCLGWNSPLSRCQWDGVLVSSLSWLHSHEPSLEPRPPGC